MRANLWNKILQCFNTERLDDRKGIWPGKSWVLVCWWGRFDPSFVRLIAPDVTTTAVTISRITFLLDAMSVTISSQSDLFAS